MRKLPLIIFLLTLIGCDLAPETIAWNDPRLTPMKKAIEAVDRNSYGFTAIQSSSSVKLESRPSAQYDAMLHIYGNTSRTIAFKKMGGEYKWIGEQETHTGPSEYESPDGTFYEKIIITFETENISGYEPNKLHIVYFGDDPRLKIRYKHTLAQITPILKEWNSQKR